MSRDAPEPAPQRLHRLQGQVFQFAVKSIPEFWASGEYFSIAKSLSKDLAFELLMSSPLSHEVF